MGKRQALRSSPQAPWGEDRPKMLVVRAERAEHPALQGAWAPPASAPPLVRGVSSRTLTMQMKLLG